MILCERCYASEATAPPLQGSSVRSLPEGRPLSAYACSIWREAETGLHRCFDIISLFHEAQRLLSWGSGSAYLAVVYG